MRSVPLLLLALCLPLLSCATRSDTPNNGEAYARPKAQWREYYFGLLRTGPDFAKAKAEGGKAIQDGHRTHVAEGIQSGALIMAGAFESVSGKETPVPGPKVRGVLIFSTYDLGDVNEWVAEDPALEAGVFKLEIFTLVAPRGLTFKGREALIQEIIQDSKDTQGRK